jgi:hypothetical protein
MSDMPPKSEAREGELRDLLARVEAATGRDSLINRDLAVAIGGCVWERRGRDRREWLYPIGKEWFYRRDDADDYTGSLDAALGLVERVLPDAGVKLTVYLRRGAYVRLQGASLPDVIEATSAARNRIEASALALLAALLRALIAQSGQIQLEEGE